MRGHHDALAGVAMPVSSAARALEVLLALSLLLQTLEYLRMRQALTVQGATQGRASRHPAMV